MNDKTESKVMNKLPIGCDDFAEIIHQKLYFVDKSLFIKELLDNPAQVALITRPRRFGKSLNMSMLRYFFAAEVLGVPTQGLFDQLSIAKAGDEYMNQQGKYPVIYLTLKEATGDTAEEVYDGLRALFARVYADHRVLLDSPQLSDTDKSDFLNMLNKTADKTLLKNALFNLSAYLYQHYGEKVIILIDEYDAPIQSAYSHGFYSEMIDFIRSLFGNALKSNSYLHRAVLTGIVRVSKESIFSGLNNLQVYSVLNARYSSCFGFLEEEVKTMLAACHLDEKLTDIRSWYNGYHIGKATVYNPWSIISYLADEAKTLQPYWVNTSGNRLINENIGHSTAKIKSDMELLLNHKSIIQSIDENFVYADLKQDGSVIWSLLLASGYLTATNVTIEEGVTKCELCFPNYEVETLYRKFFKAWFSVPMGGEEEYSDFLKDLVQGRLDVFTIKLKDYFEKSASFFDVSGNQPEKFYHGFVLGLIAGLQNTHEVISNRESGYGRYDIMIIPKNKAEPGLVLEFKTVRDKEKLITAAKQALLQIQERGYEAQLKQQGINTIFKLGLAFRAKEVEVAVETSTKTDLP